MSNPQYLTGFAVENFRCFGSFCLDFEPRPGIVLLVGPNGLGKTSWFEAVEIALTSQVARWQDVEQRVKVKVLPVRQDAKDAWVRLAFGTQKLSESPVVWDTNGSRPSGVTTLLCDNPHAWGLSEENLSGFLRATHFFPQSPSVRALHKPPVDRWEQILRHVSGFDQLSRLSENLGHGVLRAITYAKGQRDARRLERVSELEVWQRRIAALKSKENSRKLQGDALSPLDVFEKIGSQSSIRLIAAENTESCANELLGILDQKIGAIVESLATSSERVARLEREKDTPVLWSGVVEELQHLEASAQRAFVAHKLAQTEYETGLSSLATLEARQLEASRERELYANLLTIIDELVIIAEQIQLAEAELELSSASLARLNSDLAAAEVHLARVSELRERRLASESITRVLVERRAKVDQARVQRARLTTLETELHSLSEEETRLNADLEAGELTCRTREAERRRLSDSHAITTHELLKLRERSASVQAAVSVIIENLHQQSTECPVCQAAYAEGELAQRARDAVMRTNPSLVHAEDALRAQESALEMANSLLNSSLAACKDLKLKLQQIEQLKLSLRAEADRIQGDPLLSTPAFEQEIAALVQEESQQALMQFALDGDLAAANTTANHVDTLVASITADIDNRRRRLSEAKINARHIERRMTEANNRRIHLEGKVSRPAGVSFASWRDTAVGRLSDHENALIDIGSQVIAARRSQDERQLARLDRGAENERESARLEGKQREKRQLEVRWANAALSGPPALSCLYDELQRVRREMEDRSTERETILRVRSHLDAWLQDVELRKERASLEEQAKGADEKAFAAYERRLQTAIEEATVQRDGAIRAHQVARQLADASLAKKESLYRTLQRDLEASLFQLLPLLIKDSMFHEIVASIEAHKRSTSFSPRSADGVQIEAIASEGQLSGLGFSVQLAMALSFPWSRWRCLLLDDPLQYSDIVHTSNLVEVLRLLALQHQFQIFLSTHDRTLADYTVRKFRNAGLVADRLAFREAPNSVGRRLVRLQ